VEEVLHLNATQEEIAETLDVGALMGGTLAMKSVRHAFSVMDELKPDRRA
jgi:alkylhydroperoxidase/carboxymuconolactone decarboxylase family protein YurZ